MLAYGLNVDYPQLQNDLLGEPTASWHSARVTWTSQPPPEIVSMQVEDSRARLDVPDVVTVDVERTGFEMTLRSPRRPSLEEVTHPLLAFAGAVIASWTGRTALHGACVLVQGRAWVLLALPSGGKSSLVSELNARGFPVLADDLTVIEDRTALAGPRSCDLREENAALVSRDRPLVSTIGRPRFRELLGPSPCEAPLGGFVALEWGDDVVATPLDAVGRLTMLATHDALSRGPARPDAFLSLLALPAFTLRRPRIWSAIDATVEALMAICGAEAAPCGSLISPRT